ncbi:MAG TPA: endolytic transglycosylase MltG [Acidobacteria bacterium]|nr:endolytic transglycosylase MltG [Acidobacteriota bacterium]
MAQSKAKARASKRGGKGGFRNVLLGLMVLLLLLAVPAAFAGWSWWKLQRPYKGYPDAERQVSIEPGTGANQILQILQKEGVLADAKLARFYLVYFMGDPALQAGDYSFRGPLSTPDVLTKLTRGQVVTASVTLIEGLTLEEAAERLEQAGLGEREVFLDLMRSPELIADLDPEAPDLEGYLFPETYSFARHTDEQTVVSTLVKTFRQRWEKSIRPLGGDSPQRSLREIVTLASIVEKEAQVASERPLIAGVYLNRVRGRIGLMADPTVIYALKRLGRWNGNIRRSDLQVDSPYNTYRYAGLPPGPICSPGQASLEAAADPADVPYLYFVSRNDGTHVFASTLQEHNRNVEIWQRQYWRDRRARERRER